MMTPDTCRLWRDPEGTLAQPLKTMFELVETISDGSHDWRYVLRCRGCGQLYLYDVHEEIDWETGNDPSWVTWIPFESAEELYQLKQTSSEHLRDLRPYLMKDWTRNAERPDQRWVVADWPERAG